MIATTKGAVLYETGKPLRIEELTIPALQDGQILVEVAYSGVCRSQLMEVRGKRGEDRFLPHLLGHEGSGTVVEVGAQVRKVRPGDQVVLTWIKGNGADCAGAQYLCRETTIQSGPVTTFNRYTVVSENRCVLLPDGVPLDVACLLGCAVLTGAGIVLNELQPHTESSIAIWGIGGIGLSALMAAKLCECAVIVAIDVETSKLQLAREFGATHLVNSKEESPLDRLRVITNGKGIDFAVEAAGRTDTIEQAFQSLRKNGGLCIFASHPPTGDQIRLDPHDLVSGKQIRGSWGGASLPDRDIPRFAQLYRSGELPLERLITHRYGLDEINDAFDELEQGTAGRVLIEMT